MKKYLTIHQNKSELEQFYSTEKFEYKEQDYVNKIVYNLDRFTHLENGEILEDLDGEYVLFSDVLKVVSILFSTKTDLEKVTNLTLYVQSGLLKEELKI